MLLNKSLSQQCLDIINDLCRHPISDVFLEPVDPELDGVPDYLDIIHHPSDLTTVKTRLQNGTYKTLDEFKHEVNLIWENAITYNTKQSLPAYIADELSRIFQRRMWYLENPQIEQWTNDFLQARSTLCRLFRNPPSGLANFAFSPDQIIQPEQDRPSTVHKLSAEDNKFFTENMEYLTSDEHFTAISKIITDAEPSTKTSKETIFQDLAKLMPRTRRSIRSYIIKVQHPQEATSQQK